MKIVIGVTHYGALPIYLGFLRSFWNNCDQVDDTLVPILVDDGTPDKVAVRETEQVCKRWNFEFVRHDQNRGISAAWNTILQHKADADLCVIFNNDIRFLAPGWLTRLKYFFEHNEQIGTVGLPLVNEPGFNDADPRWDNPPGRVGAAVGCAFAVRPRDALSIVNPDGSRGYWENLLSFHEEIHLGFKLASKGLLSAMLPWPAMRHIGGATFQANPELIWRDFPAGYDLQEFLRYTRACQWYIPQYEEEYLKGKTDRMTTARYMFAKEWGLLEPGVERYRDIKSERVDTWEEPQKPPHLAQVDKWPLRKIKWLDRQGQPREIDNF